MPVLMMVVPAAGRRVVMQAARQISGHGVVSGAGHTGAQLDPRLRQRVAGARADTAAQQDVDFQAGQEPGQGAVSAAFGEDGQPADNLAVFDVIHPELLAVPKVLKNIPVFVRYCNSHDKRSFFRKIRGGSGRKALPARTSAALPGQPGANLVRAAFNHENLAVDQTVGQLAARAFIDFGHCRTRNVHLPRALFVGLLFIIDQANRLVFVDRQHDIAGARVRARFKTAIRRFCTDPPASSRPRHTLPSIRYSLRHMSII